MAGKYDGSDTGFFIFEAAVIAKQEVIKEELLRRRYQEDALAFRSAAEEVMRRDNLTSSERDELAKIFNERSDRADDAIEVCDEIIKELEADYITQLKSVEDTHDPDMLMAVEVCAGRPEAEMLDHPLESLVLEPTFDDHSITSAFSPLEQGYLRDVLDVYAGMDEARSKRCWERRLRKRGLQGSGCSDGSHSSSSLEAWDRSSFRFLCSLCPTQDNAPSGKQSRSDHTELDRIAWCLRENTENGDMIRD
jgi:hypothetical protein